jgi:hypothetical protein
MDKRCAKAWLAAAVSSMCFQQMAWGVEDGTTSARNARAESSARKANVMKIRLTIDGKTVDALLDDNATARDFLSLLPLMLTLRDYVSTEKIADLPKKLSTSGAPAGYDPEIGDLAYYAPWGNLSIFYRDFRYADGLVRLGRIESGVEALDKPGSIAITIESAGN